MEIDLNVNKNQSILMKFFQNLLFFLPAILIDTSNFSESFLGSRWNYIDKLAFEKIIEINNMHFPKKVTFEDTMNFYEELNKIKFDENLNLKLGIEKIYKKDKKNFLYENHRIIWSSLQVKLDKIIETYSKKSLEDFMEKNFDNENLWVVNYFDKGDFCNLSKIAFYFNRKHYDYFNLKKKFEEDFEGFLKNEISGNFYRINFDDVFIRIELNSSFSMKKFEPCLKKFINSIDK